MPHRDDDSSVERSSAAMKVYLDQLIARMAGDRAGFDGANLIMSTDYPHPEALIEASWGIVNTLASDVGKQRGTTAESVLRDLRHILETRGESAG